jgi:hypothetical protein
MPAAGNFSANARTVLPANPISVLPAFCTFWLQATIGASACNAHLDQVQLIEINACGALRSRCETKAFLEL